LQGHINLKAAWLFLVLKVLADFYNLVIKQMLCCNKAFVLLRCLVIFMAH